MNAHAPTARHTAALLVALLLASCGRTDSSVPAQPAAQQAEVTPTASTPAPSLQTALPDNPKGTYVARKATETAMVATMAAQPTALTPIGVPTEQFPYPLAKGLEQNCGPRLEIYPTDRYTFHSCWSTYVDVSEFAIRSGYLNADPSQGIVEVSHTLLEPNDEIGNRPEVQIYLAPSKHGDLTMIDATLPHVTLQAQDGTMLGFNLDTGTFAEPPPPTRTPGPSAQLAFPNTPVLDDFARADGALGSHWQSATITPTLHHQRVWVGTGISTLTWDTAQATDQEAFVTLTGVEPGIRNIILQLKRQNRSRCDLLQVDYDQTTHTVAVETCQMDGQYEYWLRFDDAIPVTFQTGDVFGARALGDGTVLVYRNGTPIGRAQVDATWPYRNQGGQIGVSVAQYGNTLTLDDFGGGSLSLTTPTNLPTATSTIIPTATHRPTRTPRPGTTATPTAPPTATP